MGERGICVSKGGVRADARLAEDAADLGTSVHARGAGKCIRTFRSADEAAGRVASFQVHTKVVPDESVLGSVDTTYLRLALQRSLNRLNVDRLDLVHLHWYVAQPARAACVHEGPG